MIRKNPFRLPYGLLYLLIQDQRYSVQRPLCPSWLLLSRFRSPIDYNCLFNKKYCVNIIVIYTHYTEYLYVFVLLYYFVYLLYLITTFHNIRQRLSRVVSLYFPFFINFLLTKNLYYYIIIYNLYQQINRFIYFLYTKK